MSKQTAILSARRTDSLEALLQKLWALRPELKDKQAITINLGVAALIREVERADQVGTHLSQLSPPPSMETTAAPEPNVRPADVSDDVEW